MNYLLQRIIAGIILFLSVLVFPWWLTATLVVLFIFYFDFYAESLLAGFLMDSLYGFPTELWFGWTLVSLSFVSAVFLLSFPIKERVWFYPVE